MMPRTPGPWRVGRPGSVVADVPVPEMRGSDDVEYYGGHLVAESVTESNAVLIAAAPELLDALKAIVEQFGPWHDGDCPGDDTCDCSAKPFHDKVNAAIAKAEGRS